VAVHTSDTPVQIQGLMLTAVADIDITVQGSEVPRQGFVQFTVSFERVLRSAWSRAAVHAEAIMSDGTIMPVTATNGLRLQSLEPNVLETEGSSIIALSSGNRSLFMGHLDMGPCGSISSYGSVTVQLPAAKNIRLETETTSLAPSNDVAAMPGLGVADRSRVRVWLQFSDSTEREVTLDDRTHYHSVDTQVRIVIQNGEAFVEAVSGALGGDAQLEVSFLDANVSQSVTFTIVRTVQIEAFVSPFPIYPGASCHRS
jgi:hypothetical protein